MQFESLLRRNVLEIVRRSPSHIQPRYLSITRLQPQSQCICHELERERRDWLPQRWSLGDALRRRPDHMSPVEWHGASVHKDAPSAIEHWLPQGSSLGTKTNKPMPLLARDPVLKRPPPDRVILRSRTHLLCSGCTSHRLPPVDAVGRSYPPPKHIRSVITLCRCHSFAFGNWTLRSIGSKSRMGHRM